MKKNLWLLMIVLVTGTALHAQEAPKKIYSKKYIRSLMIKAANWQLNNPKHDPREWTNGAFYAGVVATWQTTGSKDIYRALVQLGNEQHWQPFRNWYHADHIAISQTYLDIYKKEKRMEMLQPTLDTVKKLLANPYPAKNKIDVIKWWWCDALFMGPPVLVKLADVTGDKRYLDSCNVYFKQTYDLLYDKEEHLFARDLNFIVGPDGKGRKESNGNKIFWSRGNGWVMGGLAKIMQGLPAGYANRPFYEQLFKELAARIATLQPDDGMWRVSLLNPQAYPNGEVSGTGFFCYALAWGINNNLLDKKTFLPVVEKAWTGLTQCVHDDGMVGWVQPIGAAPSSKFTKDSWEVYGTGAFLLAASEVIKLRR